MNEKTIKCWYCGKTMDLLEAMYWKCRRCGSTYVEHRKSGSISPLLREFDKSLGEFKNRPSTTLVNQVRKIKEGGKK